MFTVLKLTLANVRQKKFRSALIILSIVLSVALMYTILSLSSQTTKIFEQKIRKEAGNAQLMVLPKENSGEQTITELDFTRIDNLEYHIPLISAYGYSKIEETDIPVIFTGMSSEDYDTIYGLSFIENSEVGLSGYRAFIGKETAEVYRLGLGDRLEVTVGGEPKEFIISGIVKDTNNNLSYDLGRLELVVSRDTLSGILGLLNQVNGYYMKGNDQTSIAELQSELEEAFPNLQIKDLTDLSDYKQMIQMVVTSLMLMVSAVIMVSAFIIQSSFKIITIERMPLMGTLRSIGATKNMTFMTLLSEAVLYGLIGGVIGNGLGIVILRVTMTMMFKTFGLSVENVSYISIGYLSVSLLIGLGLAMISAVVPIFTTAKKSIKSIIFAEIKNEKHVSVYKTITGIILIGVGFVLFIIAPVKLALPFTMIGMLFVTIGGAMVIPMLTGGLSILLTLLLKPIYRDRLNIVSNNLKNDRTMMNNIMLLAMGLGVILMINNFSTTVSDAVVNVYGTGQSDALVFYDLEDSFVEKVKAVEGVEHVYTNIQVNNLTANNGTVNLMYVGGIDGRGYSEYAWDEFGKYMTDDLMKTFTAKRSALVTRFTARKYDLSIGDMLNIDFDGKSVPYEIIAIVPSIMNNGNVTYVNEDFLAEDSGVKNSQSMYINIADHADTEQVLQNIRELLPYGILPIQTLKAMQDNNMKQNNALFLMMKAVSVIAMFIGVVGILNNFTISFLSRKKLMATMRSLGLSKNNTISNLLLEAFICGLLGTVGGLILGTVLLKAMCFVVEAMGIPADVMFYSAKDYLFVLASGIILSLASAILPAISIAKENIVAGLRYE